MITGTYNLIADSSWALSQFQEVRLECDTTLGAVTINLPAISTLAQSTNLKLIVVDATANANVNNITINAGSTGLPPVSDTFDDSTTNQIVLDTNGSSVIFQNVAATQWIATESISGGGGTLPTIEGAIMNVTPSEVIAAQIPRFFSTGIYIIDPPIIHTGTTNETVLSTQFIKGNTFRVGDFFDGFLFSFDCQVIKISATDIIFNFYQNTTPDLSGSPLLLSTFTSTGNRNSNVLIQGPNFSTGVIGRSTGKAIFTSETNLKVIETQNFPITYADFTFGDITVDSYFILTCILSNALDSSVVYSQGTNGLVGRNVN
jgi:hypothetical protein